MSGATSIPYMGILGIILITMRLGPADATIGYDCETQIQNTQIQTIPLQEIDNCDIAAEDLKMSSEYIALLQLNEFEEATILQCKIEIHRVINSCGSQSSNSLEANSISEYIYPISRKDCEVALDHGLITIGNTIIDGLSMDGTSSHNIILAGSVDSTGACTGGNYSDPYGTWNNVVVTGTARITLQSHSVKVDVDSDTIELPSGYQCKLSKGQCIDPDGGYTFRDTLPLRLCYDKMYSILYNGTATKLKSEDVTVYSVIVEDTRFSFSTNINETSCGATFFKTESPRLLVVESEGLKHLEKFKIVGTHTDNMDIFQITNDKFVHVEKYIRYPIRYLFENVIEHKCKREKIILKTMLVLAPKQPDQFAFEYMRGPGYTAIIAKDRFHIVQCVPVEVQIQQQDKCYNQQPILRGNQSLFLTPWTHIISNNATELPCNLSLSQDHELNSTSHEVSLRPVGTPEPALPEPKPLEPPPLKPKPLEYKPLELKPLESKPLEPETLEPKRLKPKTKLTWEYQNLENLANSGIYNEKDVENAWDRINHPEQFNPPPAIVDRFPDANGTTYGVLYQI